MAEYIEREALRQEIERIYQKHFAKSREKFVQDTFKAMFKRINNAPAADVVEVKHGRWELVTTKYFPGQTVRVGYCQKCNEERIVDNYCPNCGARMDGE